MKRIELHAKTKYSMDHESTIDIKNLILKCKENGEQGVAIVDDESVISFLKAEKILKELKIKDFKLIYGVQLNVFYNDNTYKMVVLVKNKNGISALYKEINVHNKHKKIPLSWLRKLKKYFILGLIYEEENYDENLLEYVDYIEIDNKVSKENVDKLKQNKCVVYTNRINSLSKEEEITKKVLYDKLRIKEKIDNRIYQTTEEILDEVNDVEIVVDNSNKIFNMIENFDILDNEMLLPSNNDFDIDLLVYIKLHQKFGLDVPKKVEQRVDEELKLIHEYKYDGFINIYKQIIEKIKGKEEYMINDYITYLYIAYLLEITHLDPIKAGLNYDIFFSNYLKISIKISNNIHDDITKFIKKDLGLNTIRGKSIMKLNGYMLNKTIEKYEEKNNVKLSLDEKTIISKYLDDYPINDNFITLKEIVFPSEIQINDYTPSTLVDDDNNKMVSCTQIDYKDIEHKFMTIEILSNDNLNELNELKKITNDKVINNYKDQAIINSIEFKNHLKIYEKYLILDDLYEELIDNNIELPDVFNIINEIRKDKKISKKTKEILLKNNIKLKKYHNINFINKGTLNEQVRLIYELLYFKKYYKLEYYYVMLKNCPFNNVIEIMQKGYEMIIKKLNEYPEYRYEYKYLKLVKELYESNINFIIEERIMTENFIFKLDKENKKITLITNKLNNKINKYLSNFLSLIGTRPVNGKMPYISKLVYKLLKQNKNITLFGLGGMTNYYLEYLLSEITKIDRKIIHQYLNPCSCFVNEVLDIDKEKYIEGIKYLLNHELTIKDYHNVQDSIIKNVDSVLDKIIYMSSSSDVVIIDNIECIKENLKTILEKLKKVSIENNIKLIIFTNLKREYEVTNKKDISSFENNNLLNKYFDNISILDGEEIYEIEV